MEQLGKKSALLKYQRILNELGDYSYFDSEVKNGKLHIRGNLDVGYGDANSFSIEIIVDENFPKKIPRVYERGGRIPVSLYRHFMTDGSGCCLVIPHQYREIYDGTTPFSDFIDKLVVPFFQNQIYYEITGEFVMGYAHGQYGMNEFYEETFGKTDTLTLFRLIECVLRQKVGGHKDCPCQSGKRQRQCHGVGLTKLAKYGDIGHLQAEYDRCQQILEKQLGLKAAIDDYIGNGKAHDYVSVAVSISRRLHYFSNPKIQLTPEALADLI